MATSENAKLMMETGQTLTDYTAMTDSGDHIIHTAGTKWSEKNDGVTDYSPVIRPNGIVTGRGLVSAHADNDKVSIAEFTAYLAGTEYTVSATTATFTRPVTASKACVYGVHLDSDGSTINVVKGTISADQTFSDTRDAAGGPPYVPVGDIEICQIRITTSTAAALDDDEIYEVPGTHQERYDSPGWTYNAVGEGSYASDSDKKDAFVELYSALSAIHTGDTYKKIYIKYYTPAMTRLNRVFDFVGPETTHSVSSQQTYDGPVGSTSSQVGQGSFSLLANDNITDAVIAEKNQNLMFEFFPDENKSPYLRCQGILGITRTFPTDNQNQVDATISSEVAAADFTS